MNTHRTVAWLVIILIATPFLAIPEWLLQLVVVVLGLAIISTVWIDKPNGEKSIKSLEATAPSSDDGGESVADKHNTSETGKDNENDNKSDKEPVDIEDPDADTMVAADRWRSRTSRDLS
jgi:uncharacterized membrane protein